jgi:hypothetical protein
MLCGYAAYRETGAARGFCGDRAHGGDTDSGERVGDIDAERLGALEQGADSVGAG